MLWTHLSSGHTLGPPRLELALLSPTPLSQWLMLGMAASGKGDSGTHCPPLQKVDGAKEQARRQTRLCVTFVRWGCLTYEPAKIGRKAKGIFPRRKASPKLQANGLPAHKSRAASQLGQAFSFTCPRQIYLPGAALHGIAHPRAPRRGGSHACRHCSGELYVHICAAKQKKTAPCNLTATGVLGYGANSSPFSVPVAWKYLAGVIFRTLIWIGKWIWGRREKSLFLACASPGSIAHLTGFFKQHFPPVFFFFF